MLLLNIRNVALLKSIVLLEKMVSTNETVLFSRIFRNNTKVRSHLKSSLLAEVVEKCLAKDNQSRISIMSDISFISVVEGAEQMEIDSPALTSSPSKGSNANGDNETSVLKVTSTPEVQVYLHWLTLLLLLKYKLYEQVSKFIIVRNYVLVLISIHIIIGYCVMCSASIICC